MNIRLRYVAGWLIVQNSIVSALCAYFLGMHVVLWAAAGLALGLIQAILIYLIWRFRPSKMEEGGYTWQRPTPDQSDYTTESDRQVRDIFEYVALALIGGTAAGLYLGFSIVEWLVAIPVMVSLGGLFGAAYNFGKRFWP